MLNTARNAGNVCEYAPLVYSPILEWSTVGSSRVCYTRKVSRLSESFFTWISLQCSDPWASVNHRFESQYCYGGEDTEQGRSPGRLNVGSRLDFISLSTSPPRAPAPRNVEKMARPRACFYTKWVHVLEAGERITRVAPGG